VAFKEDSYEALAQNSMIPHGLALTLMIASMAVLKAAEEVLPGMLSAQEAKAMVDEEVDLALKREKERLAEIKSVMAIHVTKSPLPSQKVTMRRVASKPWPARPPVEIPDGAVVWTEEQLAAWRDTQVESRTVILSATVFDRKITELTWRNDGKEFTAISNIDFNYLAPIIGFDNGKTHWSAFFFVENVKSEKRERGARLAMINGWEHVARTIPDAKLLQSDAADYKIYADDAEDVPLDLIAELDALHEHYAANEKELKVAWQHREALNDARRAWAEANQAQPKDTVINFWPVRSRAQAKD